VRFVGAARMRALNRDSLGHDEVTDVLAFPLEDSDHDDHGAGPDDEHADENGSGLTGAIAVPRLLGDVVLCSRRAAAQARAAGAPLAFEIATLLVHGTLHVLGYDHETDAGEMILRQARLLDDARWESLLGQV
jgi:probable rRNA maturation factor